MELMDQIKRFAEFIELHHHAELLERVRQGRNFLIIDFLELSKFDPALADLLLDQPEEVIKAAEVSVREFDLPEEAKSFKIRFSNLPQTQRINIRDIRSSHISKLLFTDGVVRQKSEVRPQVTSARFECPSCGNIISVLQIDTKFKEPSRCGCGRKGKFRLVSKELVDAQRIVLEETPENLEGGEQPKRMDIFLKEDLVSPLSDKKTNPGSRIIINGILKELPIILRTGGQSIRFDLFIDANFVEAVEEEFGQIEITKEEEEHIKELAKDPHIHERIFNSIAPSIYGHERIKEAIALQLIGGLRKVRDDGVVTRGDMHILLIGDPGSGKSQLLKRATIIAPKGRYVSGKGASGAGLTAAVVKDEFLRGWALEAGALVLANKGFCIAGDSAILMGDGRLKQIKDIYDEYNSNGIPAKKEVIGLDKELKNRKFRIRNVSARVPNRLYEVLFDTQDSIKITEEHPLPVWDNGIVWKPVKGINAGDYIITRTDFPSLGGKLRIKEFIENSGVVTGLPKYITDDLMEFSGLIATDGSISKVKNVIRFYTKSGELKNKYIKLVKKLFKKQPTEYVDERSGVYQLHFSSKQVCALLEGLGIKRGNKKNSCLDKLVNLPHSNIHSFIAGVINGDGSISNRKYGGCVDIICSSRKAAESYRLLLRRISIISRISMIKRDGGGIIKKGKYVTFKITVTGVENIKKFYSIRLIRRKLSSLKEIIKREDKTFTVPLVERLFRRIRDELKHTEKRLLYGNSVKISVLEKYGIKRSTLERVVKRLAYANPVKYMEEYKTLKNVADGKLIFAKVIAKKDIMPERVYNLEVESDCEPNFFANFIPVRFCMIDELDKMSKEDTGAMHEALEQQTVTISKANIQATLRAETTVLAAANPKFGRFDPYEVIPKQIDLPPTLINRFDLIFPIKDLPDQHHDEKMARFILNLHKNVSQKADIDTKLLRKYIAYVRTRIMPKLTDEAMEDIKDYYITMRGSGSSEGGIKTIPISARQLEGLVRLSEANARLRLSEKVTKKDTRKAIELLDYCLRQVGLDRETGKIDIDRITTGITASQRSNIILIKEVISELENKIGKTIPIEEIVKSAAEKKINAEKVDEVIERLKRSGDLFEPRRGFIQRI